MSQVSHLSQIPIETLTNILQWLGRTDLQTLLLAERVCTQWRDIIRETAEVQRILYFRPTLVESGEVGDGKAVDDEDEEDNQSDADAYNPLLYKKFSSILDTSTYVRDEKSRLSGSSENLFFTSLPWASDESSRAKVLHKTSSWRRMLISRYAIKELYIVHRKSSQSGIFYCAYKLDYTTLNKHGAMNMGDYYDLLLSGVLDDFSHWLLQPGRVFILPETLRSSGDWHDSESHTALAPYYWLNPHLASSRRAAVLMSGVNTQCDMGGPAGEGSWSPTPIEEPTKIECSNVLRYEGSTRPYTCTLGIS